MQKRTGTAPRLLALATFLGHVTAGALAAARFLPAALGLVCTVVGLYLAWPPLGWLGAGALLILADRRVP